MNIWLIIYRISSGALVIMLVVAIASIFMPKLRENETRQSKVVALEKENRVKADMTQELRRRHKRFQEDPAYVERIAREELGKAKPDEVIFRFVEPATNTARRP